MSREAIEHVTAAERTVAQIRQDANEKIRQIKSVRDEKINEINESLAFEIQSFKQNERLRYEEELENKIQNNKEAVRHVAQEYEKSYSGKQGEISDYIVKEVLKRYGN